MKMGSLKVRTPQGDSGRLVHRDAEYLFRYSGNPSQGKRWEKS